MLKLIAKRVDVLFAALIVIALAYLLLEATDLPGRARFFPIYIGTATLTLAIIQLIIEIRRHQTIDESDLSAAVDIGADKTMPRRQAIPRIGKSFAWFTGFVIAALYLGFYITVPVFLITYLLTVAKISLPRALAITAAVCLVIFGIFDYLLELRIPRGTLIGWRPFS